MSEIIQPYIQHIEYIVLSLAAALTFIFFILWSGFKPKNIRRRMELRRKLKTSDSTKFWMKSKILIEYHHLISSVSKKYKKEHMPIIIWIQLVSFILIFVVLLISVSSIRFAFVVALFFAIFGPIGVVWVRYKRLQTDIQNKLNVAVDRLLKEYQKNRNVLYALKTVSQSLEGDIRLSFAMYFARLHGSKEEQQLASETFAYQVGQNWGVRLSRMILKAAQDGTDIEVNLKDLHTDLSEFQKIISEENSEGLETAALGFAPIFGLIIMFFSLNRIMPDDAGFHSLFSTTIGVQIFVLSIILALINLVMAIILRRPNQGL